MIILRSMSVLLFVLFLPLYSWATDVCSVPPFWSSPTQPNVLMVLDESGSMAWEAHFTSAYSPQKSYYGYFKTDKFYRYDPTAFSGVFSSPGGFVEVSLSSCSNLSGQKVCSEDRSVSCSNDSDCQGKGKCIDAIGGPDCISGNLLNWATMSRIDILRKVLIGGKSVATIDSGNTYIIRAEGDGSDQITDSNLACIFQQRRYFSGTRITISNSGANMGVCGHILVKGKGTRIWGGSDNFYFVYQRLNGDFDVRLKIVGVPNTAYWAKTVLMARASLSSSSRHIMLSAANLSGGHRIQFARRPTDGSGTDYVGYFDGYSLPIWVRLKRSGQTFTGYYSYDGQNWTSMGSYTFSGSGQMPSQIYVGIGTASYNSGKYGTGEHDEFVCYQCNGGSSDDFDDGHFDTNIWSTATIGSSSGQVIESCGGGGCAVGTLNNAYVRLAVPRSERRGIIQNVLDKDEDGNIDNNAPRLGLEVFSSGSGTANRRGCIRVGITNATLNDLINTVENETPTGGTPTRYGIEEAYDYLTQSNNYSNCNNSAFIGGRGSSKDPWYDEDPSNPGSYIGLPCRKSYVVTISDGEWNTGGEPIGITYTSHINDIRPDLSGKQSLTHYTVFIFSNETGGRRAMKNMAMYGGFNDLDGNNWPYNVSGYPSPNSKSVNLPSVCDPNSGTPPEGCREWDSDGDGNPDKYYEASSGKQLEEALATIFKQIQVSGAAASVATVTQQVLGEDIVVRGAFENNPNQNEAWKGHLEAYWPYSACSGLTSQTECEDEPACEWVNNSCQEKCGNYTSESSCNNVLGCSWNNNSSQCVREKYSFESSLNEGKFCSDADFQGGHCWDAGEKLSNQGTRTIFTFISNQKTDFSFANVNNYLDLDSECDFNGDGNVDDNDKQKLVNWVVGTEDGDGTHMRNRNGWLLGDIVYSTPLVVGQPSLGSVPKVVAKDSCKALQPCFQYKNETDCSSHLNDYGCYWDRIDGSCEAMDCSRLNETVCNNQPVCQWNATEGVCEEVSVSSDSCFYTWRLKDDIAHRKKVAYVGANDGMLHAFLVGVWWDDPDPSTDSDGDGEADESHWIYNPDEPDSLCDGHTCTGKEDIGQELWAYIPSNLLSELKELAKPTYAKESGCLHRTMIDLSPEGWDVYMDLDNDGVKEWHTILIGGERGGGDVYFAIDVTDPEDPQVLWEFSTLRNMVYVSGSNGNYSADMPYLDKNGYDQIKTIAASWSNPYVGRIKIPDNYCFYSIPHIGPLDNNPSNLTALCYGGSQYPLSGWFAFIGGGIRVFDPSYELISGDNGAAYYPYFIVLDIKTGTNIFQFLWPLLRLHAGITTIHQNSNYIPYAVASPVALDIWDENGNIGQDGYMDHLYAGDLNGNFYGIKLNPSNNSFPLSLDIWNTKPISSSHVSDNYYRWTRQPITVTPTAAFDDNYNLMLYFGTGKFDDVVAGGYDDKTDRARMSFYALKDPSGAPSVLLPACQPIGSSPFTINCTLPSGITTIHGCSSFNSNCTWVKDDGTPDCCESNCSSSCYSCIYDFIEDGERVIDSALVAGGLVFVTTYVPSDDPCAAGGVGYLYVFDYMCRQLTENPFENADLQYEHLSQTGWTQGAPSGGGAKAYRANLGSGMPSKPVLDSGGEHVLIQTSDAKIHRIKVKLPQNPLYLKGWKEKE